MARPDQVRNPWTDRASATAGTKAEPLQGVYFRRADYAGFWQRLLIECVDLATAAVIWLIVSVGVVAIVTLALRRAPNDETLYSAMVLTALPSGLAYFVLLKRFGRSVGYWLGRARLVDLSGNGPSLWALLLRFLFATFGPVNVLLDLVWIPSDQHRQALRDKVAKTYVVKSTARPAGRGSLRWVQYYALILGGAPLFVEVERPTRSASADDA